MLIVEKIHTDNHIRKMLDPVPPDELFSLFGTTLKVLGERGALRFFHCLDRRVLFALEGQGAERQLR